MNQKHVFWQALLITVFIFGLGILTGFVLENWRTGKIDSLFQQSEINLLDVKLQNQIYAETNFNCNSAIQENIQFADRIYEEAKLLDRYETATRLSTSIFHEHKKYDLLRALLLLNSIKIKEKCNASYYEVVYFYNFNEQDLDKKAKQSVFSNQLRDIKEIKGREMLLIPIAGNLDVSSINLLMEMYNVNENELPVIVINKKIKITELKNIDDVLRYFK